MDELTQFLVEEALGAVLDLHDAAVAEPPPAAAPRGLESATRLRHDELMRQVARADVR